MHVGPIYSDMGEFDILARWWHFSCVTVCCIEMCLFYKGHNILKQLTECYYKISQDKYLC